MSATTRRVLSGVTRAALSRGIFAERNTATIGTWNSVRPLAVSAHMSAASKDSDEDKNKPIKFSTSKASHRTWRVNRSMGSDHERPWWRVLPISLAIASFLLWCALRGESAIDTQLEKTLQEHLPDLISEEEEQNKSS